MVWSIIKLALSEVGRNALRSSLTILGIVIGVGAVISMVTLGGGAASQITSDISSLGSNMLILRPGTQGGAGGVTQSASRFELNDAEAIQEEIMGIKAVAPFATAPVVSVYGNNNWSTNVNGTNNDFLDVRDWTLRSGRLFSDADLRSGRLSCLLGATVVKELFGYGNPIGTKIRLNSVPCTIIGVLEEKGESSFGSDQDNIILMPIKTYQRRISGNSDIAIIFISVQEGISSTQVQTDVTALMKERRNIRENEENDFTVDDIAEITETVESTTGILTTFLGAIAAISLLVGGIGIMNIMLVSVTERTREIGIRLAIGALGREVLFQFLMESIILSLIGGMVGILFGLGLAALIAPMLGIPFVFDALIVIIAFLFSGAVGIIFGFFPARRAARLDPIDALRYE